MNEQLSIKLINCKIFHALCSLWHPATQRSTEMHLPLACRAPETTCFRPVLERSSYF